MCEILRPGRASVHPQGPAAGRTRQQKPAHGDGQQRIEECIKSVREFCRECARHMDVMMGLGSSQDSARLREELRKIRRRVCDLALSNQALLLPPIRSTKTPAQDRERYEKMWNVFTTCLETLHAQLCKSLNLTQLFPIHLNSCVLIKTGNEGNSNCHFSQTTKAGTSSANTSFDKDLQMLKRDYTEIRTIMLETQNKVDVKPWTFEADPETSKFYSDSRAESDAESVDSVPSPEHVEWARRRRKCICLIAVGLVSVGLFATVLGVCLAEFT